MAKVALALTQMADSLPVPAKPNKTTNIEKKRQQWSNIHHGIQQ
tara:strand:+ start:147 stop:278 length:132 start_codon:yes stop_codon:yes gene_type:complete